MATTLKASSADAAECSVTMAINKTTKLPVLLQVAQTYGHRHGIAARFIERVSGDLARG